MLVSQFLKNALQARGGPPLFAVPTRVSIINSSKTLDDVRTIFREAQGNAIAHVDIPAEQNTKAVYSAAMVSNAIRVDAARSWLSFIRTDAAFNAIKPFRFQRIAE